MIDIEKRKRVMKRSIELGHCICNPKKSCPCDVFKEKDICPCAGERLYQAADRVNLTSLVEKAGCASKINRNDLKLVLNGLPDNTDPRLIVGSNTCDDAGVYLLDDKTALVQTVDVFTPVVDDPYAFGQIAAANSLSDVYAMGGKPLTALTIIAFPIETVDPRIMTQMLRGGADKLREADTVIAGGHSINDAEPKLGYSVTGAIDPNKIITNSNAQIGDYLILTKPLGTGIISFANQLGKASESAKIAAAKSMSQLNRSASESMVKIGVNAATDVTGFGLSGHLGEMTAQSGVSAEIYTDKIPIFDEVLDYVSQGLISGGIERNAEHSNDYISISEDTDSRIIHVLNDPQTSGGMLISVSPEKVDALIDDLTEHGVSNAAIIGRITNGNIGMLYVINSSQSGTKLISHKTETVMNENSSCCGQETDAPCCSSSAATDISGDTKSSFSAFMGNVMADSAISLRNKELIAIALSLLSKCEPCLKIHIDKAKSLGVSDEEISESIWMAIGFGGAPTMMFYESFKSK